MRPTSVWVNLYYKIRDGVVCAGKAYDSESEAITHCMHFNNMTYLKTVEVEIDAEEYVREKPFSLPAFTLPKPSPDTLTVAFVYPNGDRQEYEVSSEVRVVLEYNK